MRKLAPTIILSVITVFLLTLGWLTFRVDVFRFFKEVDQLKQTLASLINLNLWWWKIKIWK